jgi:hypothetical protein
MVNVLVCIVYDVNMNALDFDDQIEICYFSDKYLEVMEELLEEINKETMQEIGLEQYRIFARKIS